jgi:integrase
MPNITGGWENPAAESREQLTEPIKSAADVDRIARHMLSKGRLRDYTLFVIGCNSGLRCGDIVKLRFGHVLGAGGEPLDMCRLREEKTKKAKEFPLNDAVKNAVRLYSSRHETLDIGAFMFTSNSMRKAEHLTVRSVERMLKATINGELGYAMHVGTHTMRKTFAWQTLEAFGQDERGLFILQTLLNHSSPRTTLNYIGKTREEIAGFYQRLNLGAASHLSVMEKAG